MGTHIIIIGPWFAGLALGFAMLVGCAAFSSGQTSAPSVDPPQPDGGTTTKPIPPAMAAEPSLAGDGSTPADSGSEFKPLIDPNDAIWLDSTGAPAGTGDPNGRVGEALKAGDSPHPEALELSNLPVDQFGLVNWARAIREGYVTPRHTLDPAKQDKPDDKPFGLALLIPAKSETMPDVIFPHDIHTMWLTCNNCHPEIFAMNGALNNKRMTMPQIAAGQYCGRCHGRVAFPLDDCLRCHVHEKGEPVPDGVKAPQ